MVSICIPAYNRPRALRETIASALAQTVADVEVIVTDDGGHYQDLESEFADARLRYSLNDHRYGMSGNWERALSLTRGRFVSLLMDDDRLLPTFIERCLGVFAAEPAVGAVFTNHFFDDGRRVFPRDRLLAEGTYAHFLPLLVRAKPVAICATLMRREVWDQVLPLPDLHTADIALQVRAAQSGCVFHYIDEPLMVYRVHNTQLSGELEFRNHGVAVWRLFTFDEGSVEEAYRRRALAEALLSCAAAQLRRGEVGFAAESAREAAELDVRSADLTSRARLVAAIARSSIAMRCTRWGFRLATAAHRRLLRCDRTPTP